MERAHRREMGNIGVDLVLPICLELSRGENSTVVVVRGWNLDLSRVLLQAGCNVIFLHHERTALRNARAEVTELVADNNIVTRRFQFRTICRPIESDMSKVVAKASVVILLGALHHMSNAQKTLALLLRAGMALVVSDTTSELMCEKFKENARIYHRICNEDLVCRDAAIEAGLNVRKDVTELLIGENSIRWPALFEYQEDAFGWMAVWESV